VLQLKQARAGQVVNLTPDDQNFSNLNLSGTFELDGRLDQILIALLNWNSQGRAHDTSASSVPADVPISGDTGGGMDLDCHQVVAGPGRRTITDELIPSIPNELTIPY